ncbi:MAG: hypothetical protein U0R72_03530 [Nakamurella multipartita]
MDPRFTNSTVADGLRVDGTVVDSTVVDSTVVDSTVVADTDAAGPPAGAATAVNDRTIWLTDRYGAFSRKSRAARDDDATLAQLSVLLDTIAVDDGDEEHRTVSLTDEHEWNLEFRPDRVLLENVGDEGDEVGALRDLDRAEQLAIARDFLTGGADALRGHK